jgi:tRNA (guanosine-2'-O-)-methyltransferase
MEETEFSQLIEYLLSQISPRKRERMQEVVAQRTNHAVVLLEDLYQAHNMGAVLRSCELFGIQQVHAVQERHPFAVHPGVAKGAFQWLDVHQHSDITAAIEGLKRQGYRIVATTPHTTACYLPDFKVDQKFVFMFGTEDVGLSPQALTLADEFVKIPTVGFTESFNISVSVAICLYAVTQAMQSQKVAWQLTEDERLAVLYSWLQRQLPHSSLLEKEWYNLNNNR